jgi:predicted acetyltransferase
VALILRPFGPDDEAPALGAWAASKRPGSEFLLFDYDPRMSWAEWTALMARHREGVDLPENRVRGAFLVADVNGQLVGSVSIRFELNAFFATRGGHVGYGVIPAFRRRGYATAILTQSIEIARDEGVSPLLVTCDDANVASANVIERCGGILENLAIGDDGVAFRRYWI